MSELRALLRLRRGLYVPNRALDREIEHATNGDPLEYDGNLVGEQINFRFDEYKALGTQSLGRRKPRHPSTIRPCDASEDEVAEYLKRFHAPRKAKRKRERRAADQARHLLVEELDCRASAVFAVLTYGWKTVKQLMKALARGPAFRNGDGTGYLTGNSLRQAIIRVLDALEVERRVQIDRTHRDRRGFPMLLARRRS
jgi:hypothetical protein